MIKSITLPDVLPCLTSFIAGLQNIVWLGLVLSSLRMSQRGIQNGRKKYIGSVFFHFGMWRPLTFQSKNYKCLPRKVLSVSSELPLYRPVFRSHGHLRSCLLQFVHEYRLHDNRTSVLFITNHTELLRDGMVCAEVEKSLGQPVSCA